MQSSINLWYSSVSLCHPYTKRQKNRSKYTQKDFIYPLSYQDVTRVICSTRGIFKGEGECAAQARGEGAHSLPSSPYFQIVPPEWFTLSCLALPCLPLSPQSGIFFVVCYYRNCVKTEIVRWAQVFKEALSMQEIQVLGYLPPWIISYKQNL